MLCITVPANSFFHLQIPIFLNCYTLSTTYFLQLTEVINEMHSLDTDTPHCMSFLYTSFCIYVVHKIVIRIIVERKKK